MESRKIELFLDSTLMEFNVVIGKYDEFDDSLGIERELYKNSDYDQALFYAEKISESMNIELVKIPFEY